MESYKDKHKTEEWTVPVGCEWLGKEYQAPVLCLMVLSGLLELKSIPTTCELIPAANGQISTFSVNTSLPSAVAQCLPGHVTTFLFFKPGLVWRQNKVITVGAFWTVKQENDQSR